MAASYSTSIKPTYIKIGSYTAPSAVASYTFSNIPQNYTDLVFILSGTIATNGKSPIFQFNGDTGTTYSNTRLRGSSSSKESLATANTAGAYTPYGVGFSSTLQNNTMVNIMNYSNGTTYKTLMYKSINANGSLGQGMECGVSTWRSTSPITSILIKGDGANLSSGFTITMYGIECAKTPKADGGTVYTDGTYWYHAFRTTGLFSPKVSSLSADILVVAGGGGGGAASGSSTAGYGGGGGAGGYRSATSQSLSAASYVITVGSGGPKNTNGSDSSIAGSGFTTFTSTGGGFGGNKVNVGRNVLYDGANGGSGGGGGNNQSNVGGLGNTPSTSPSQGNNGGAGYTGGGNAAGSGGGGATGVGLVGTNNGAGGAGGAGSNAHASWASATGTGVGGYYAGGGGGGVENDTYAGGAGGSGGGGKGDGSNGDAVDGTANTGGGGGGGGDNTAKSGGSGIVIVRYAV